MALNRVVLIGRLTRDPEVRYTTAGVPVATMGIAVHRVTRNESGDYDVDFFNVVAWRRTAEFAQNYLKKGRLISVDGRLQTRSWTDQAGQKRTVVEIVADSLEGLDRREDEPAPIPENGGGSGVAAGGVSAPIPPAPPDDEDRAYPEDPDEADPFADD
ncbi:MAG: single-stranded DNA-binding protein [Chloroherpetonaceae bacterium]|nr:single-stranded DNA-binding protein [Chthonomonadaceae bacterium]MDW8206984.1 single-stranded DNA-binding protein [Chloroherpetonaceae bacterium]